MMQDVLENTFLKGVLGAWRGIAVCRVMHCTGQFTKKSALEMITGSVILAIMLESNPTNLLLTSLLL